MEVTCTVRTKDFCDALALEEIVKGREELDIRSAELNRPGLQFAGYYDFFAWERPQLIGKVEMGYLTALNPDERRVTLKRYYSYAMPCVIVARGMDIPWEMVEAARMSHIGLYRSPTVTTKLTTQILTYLNRALAEHIIQHGVLVDVYGIGVLLTGRSGIGKSEAALELVKRGHQLVADDAVDICRIADTRLIGECPELVRYLMEIRGVGLIDVKAMFGIGAVTASKTIDLVIELQEWKEDEKYDRLGLSDDSVSILGVDIPRMVIPLRPGRNLAIIIEVAARNFSLKQTGYNAAQELNHRLAEQLDLHTF